MLKKKTLLAAATVDTTSDTIDYTDTSADAVYTTPSDAELDTLDLTEITEHAQGLKAVLDEAGVGADTTDPMYADYATEYTKVKAYLAAHDIVV